MKQFYTGTQKNAHVVMVMMMLVKTAGAVSKTTANMVMKFMATLQNGATEYCVEV